MPHHILNLATGFGWFLAGLAAVGLFFAAFLVVTTEIRVRANTRAFHASARRAAGVDNPLRRTDVTDLDGQLRRLLKDEGAGQ